MGKSKKVTRRVQRGGGKNRIGQGGMEIGGVSTI